MEKLARIIKSLKAPKSQYNSFGKYHYRNCEDILEAVKPLLDGAILTITDDIMQIGDRFYVRATATFRDGDFVQSVCGWAREELDKKGMDASQITGSASSYARKYALNGLFCIDDTKDADSQNNTGKPAKEKQLDICDAVAKKEAKEKQLDICDAVAKKEAKEKVDPVVYYTGLVAKAGITGDEADILVHEFEKKMNDEQRKAECRRLLAIIKK